MYISKNKKRLGAFILSTVFTISSFPLNVFAAEPLSETLEILETSAYSQSVSYDIVSQFENLPAGRLSQASGGYLTRETEDAFLDLQRFSLVRGLVGFYGDYELREDNTMTDVIVVFEHNPAPTQVVEARVLGQNLTYEAAAARVLDSHLSFRSELSSLFGGGNELARGFGAQHGYHISTEFRRGLNGVAVTVPAYMVPELLNISVVRAVYPNVLVDLPSPAPLVVDEQGNPAGMAAGRARMGADLLHERGILGEGVLVAVIDTGVDYHHPSFAGSFITLEEMHRRGATSINQSHLLNLNGTYYYVGRDFLHLHPNPETAAFAANPAQNDPMETSPMNHPGVAPSSHGTHVAGTVAGRSVPGAQPEMNILGVAPGAYMIHYRVLFPGGVPNSIVMAAVETTYYSMPDIVNMSLGGGIGSTVGLTAIAINNLSIARPYMTFVVAAGNAGPSYYTISNWPSSPMAITVGANLDNRMVGFAGVTSDGSPFLSAFLYSQTVTNILQGVGWIFNDEYNAYISEFPTLNHENGYYRVFKMPLTPYSEAPGQVTGIGTGEPQDFLALIERYGEDVLAGNFVMVNRGSSFIDISAVAYELELGVISVNNAGQAMLYGSGQQGDNYIPFFMAYTQYGLYLRDVILENGYALVRFAESFGTVAMAGFSSRGPLHTTFEILPDVIAHGVGVLSAVPWWTVGAEPGDYSNAFAATGGTSMSSPHVAGAAALMIQYSRAAGRQWNTEEIKVRMQNTATLIPGNYGVFTIGAGHVDVYAAVNTTSVVSVINENVATVFGLRHDEQPAASTRVGSFSFGGTNYYLTQDAFSNSLNAVIENRSSSSITYTITHRFLTTGQESRSGAFLNFSTETLTVPAGGSGNFVATLTIPQGSPLGHYEGFVYVHAGSELVASLPFAGVVYSLTPLFYGDIIVYRPVISTEIFGNQNFTSAELVIGFTQREGFLADISLVRDVEGITERNWYTDEFYEYHLGFVGSRFVPHVPGFGNSQLGAVHRGIVFYGEYTPTADGAYRTLLDEEGDYFIVLELFRQHTTVGNNPFWYFYDTIFIPFSVDNTPPVVNSLEVNGMEIDLGLVGLLPEEVPPVGNPQVPPILPLALNNLMAEEQEGITISGNVFDEFLNNGSRNFDVWTSQTPYGPASGINTLALFILVGDNVPGNRPVRVPLSPNGDFTITFEDFDSEVAQIGLWLVDNFAPVPRANGHIGSTAWNAFNNGWFIPDSLAPYYFNYHPLRGLFAVDESLEQFLHHGVVYDNVSLAPFANLFAWSGLNITHTTFAIADDSLFEPVVFIEGDAPQFWEVGVPLDLSPFFNALPVYASNREIMFRLASPEYEDAAHPLLGNVNVTLEDGILTSYETGLVFVSAVVENGAISDGERVDFERVFVVDFINVLYTPVTFYGNNGLIIPADRGADLSSYFEDEYFLEYIRNSINVPNGPIFANNLLQVQIVNLESFIPFNTVESLSGIEHLPNLLFLDASGQLLTEVDLSSNLYLRHLNLSENGLSSLDVSSNLYLEYLNISGRPAWQDWLPLQNFTSIDLSNNVRLSGIVLQNAFTLEEIILPNSLYSLEWINLAGAGLTSLTLENAPLLNSINVSGFGEHENQGRLTSLEVRNLPSLLALNASANSLSSIELVNVPNLALLNLNENSFTSFDASSLQNLAVLHLALNNLNTINVNGLTNLQHLFLNVNNLTTVDLSSNVSLREVVLDSNRLTGALNVTNSPELFRLWATDNYLTSINITGTEVGHYFGGVGGFANTLRVQGNNLSSLDSVIGWEDSPYLNPGTAFDYTSLWGDGDFFDFWPQRGVPAPTGLPVYSGETRIYVNPGEEVAFRFNLDDGARRADWFVAYWPASHPHVGLELQRSGLLRGVVPNGTGGEWPFLLAAVNIYGHIIVEATLVISETASTLEAVEEIEEFELTYEVEEVISLIDIVSLSSATVPTFELRETYIDFDSFEFLEVYVSEFVPATLDLLQLEVAAAPLVDVLGYESYTIFVRVNRPIGELLPTAVREGFYLLGFNTSSDGLGEWINESSVFTLTEQSVYAVWTSVLPTITGPSTASLVFGTSANYYFEVSGIEPSFITLQSSYPQIVWNAELSRLEVSASLPASVITVTLGSNLLGLEPHEFTITVLPAPAPVLPILPEEPTFPDEDFWWMPAPLLPPPVEYWWVPAPVTSVTPVTPTIEVEEEVYVPTVTLPEAVLVVGNEELELAAYLYEEEITVTLTYDAVESLIETAYYYEGEYTIEIAFPEDVVLTFSLEAFELLVELSFENGIIYLIGDDFERIRLYVNYTDGEFSLVFPYDLQSLEVTNALVGPLPLLTVFLGQTSYYLDLRPGTNDVSPFMLYENAMVPLRLIATALGAEVLWNAETATVTLILEGSSVSLTIGEQLEGSFGTSVIEDGRTFVPVGYIAHVFGVTVDLGETNGSISLFGN